jgi:tetratricopeptide (TPR) repeat protein
VAPKIGRNQPCPCGSGRKYKRCRGVKIPSLGEEPLVYEGLEFEEDDGTVVVFDDDLDDLLRLSNRVPDLLRSGEIDEALRVCHELERRYPDEIDWRDRFAEAYEAQGDAKRAATHYRMAADFARNAEGFDPEYIAWALEKAHALDPQPGD